MNLRRTSISRLVAVALLLAFVALTVGCGSLGGGQNTFAPGGDVARDQRDIFYLALWPAIVILIIVFGLLTYALVRYRRRREDEPIPTQVHGNQRLEIAWTVLPALLLIGLAVPMLAMIVDIGRAPADDAFPVVVTGQRFSWTFEYSDLQDADGKPLSITGTPGQPAELHVPVGREIGFSLESIDVIHSFWIPKLAGKQDAVPGRTNTLWFTIDEPGQYPGQCAEFCGLLHAQMRMTIIAHSEADFQAWCEEQLGVEPGAAACQLEALGA